MNLLQRIFRVKNKNGFFDLTGHKTEFGNLNLISNMKFGNVIFLQIMRKIFDGMSGVIWEFSGNTNFLLAGKLKRLFEKDFILIYKEFWNNGFAVIAVNYELQDVQILCEKDFNILNQRIVLRNDEYNDYKLFTLKSDNYKLFNESEQEICKDIYCQCEDLLNAINATTKNMGAMGVLTPDTSGGFSPPTMGKKAKEKIQDEWQNSYGLLGKWSIMITNRLLKFTQIVLPIKDLELQNKLEGTVKLIAGFHGVPYELLPISGQSTFTNREEARIGELLNITCRAYANKLYDLATEIFLATDVKTDFKLENAKTTEQITREEKNSNSNSKSNSNQQQQQPTATN